MSGSRRRYPALLRLFPRGWRDRYADEVRELLRDSPRPVRDRLDLLRSVPGEQLLAVRSSPRLRRVLVRSLWVIAAALIAVGVLGGFWVTPQLKDGWVEIPGHWWSTLAVLPAVIGVGVAGYAARTQWHTRWRSR
jgi:hypothetical protein